LKANLEQIIPEVETCTFTVSVPAMLEIDLNFLWKYYY